jgi:hypothetical protein
MVVSEPLTGNDLEVYFRGLILKYYPGIYLEGLSKNTKNLSQGIRSLGRDAFLRAIEIRYRTSFGEEVKTSVSCHKTLRHVKDSYRYVKRHFIGKTQGNFSLSFSSFTTRCLCRLLPDSSCG